MTKVDSKINIYYISSKKKATKPIFLIALGDKYTGYQ